MLTPQQNVLMRIDYSDDPGYWDKIVGQFSIKEEPHKNSAKSSTAAPGEKKLRRKQLEEVRELHGGSYKRWIEHTWHKEKRSMDRAELHERWFSGQVLEWFTLQSEIALKSPTLHRSMDVSPHPLTEDSALVTLD